MSDPITPNQEEPRGKLGARRHKSGCACPFCTNSRKRTAKTQPLSDRPGGLDLLPQATKTVAVARKSALNTESSDEVIQADLPDIVVQDKSMRGRIAEWALLRSQGLKNGEIAARLGIQPNTLQALISRATQEGWLKFDNPAERLQYELAPKIVDNIEKALYEGSEKMTIEAAKGIGLFKSYQAVKVEGQAPSMVLALKFETPEGYASSLTPGNAIFGTPKTVEGEVIDPEKEG